MHIFGKSQAFVVVGFILGLFLSTGAVAATEFYVVSHDSNQKMGCDLLEIKNDQVLCTANNLLITYDLAQVIEIEAVTNGTSQNFKSFSEDIVNRINGLTSNKTPTKYSKGKTEIKPARFDFLPLFAQTQIDTFKNRSGANPLGVILLISGFIVLLIGSLGFLVATFREGVLWGLGSMFLPLVAVVFLFVHWKTAAKPFFISILGSAILCLSSIIPFSDGAAQSFATKAAFQCDGKTHCSEMTSCEEAKFYIRHCPGTKMDGDNDGIPCEKQWCGTWW